MPDHSQQRSELLAQVRAGLAEAAALSDRADDLLDKSADVVRDSQFRIFASGWKSWNAAMWR